jgi:hypothetical protein
MIAKLPEPFLIQTTLNVFEICGAVANYFGSP